MTTDAGAVMVEGQLGRDSAGYWWRDEEGRLWRFSHFLDQYLGPARITLERLPLTDDARMVTGGRYATS